jgi:hypothetical protein
MTKGRERGSEVRRLRREVALSVGMPAVVDLGAEPLRFRVEREGQWYVDRLEVCRPLRVVVAVAEVFGFPVPRALELRAVVVGVRRERLEWK